MPRKSYTPKNPYLKNAKISKEQFEFILSAWLEGDTPTETAKALARKGEKVSRQTVQNLYTKIGKHIWEKRFQPQYEATYISEETMAQSQHSAGDMGLDLTDEELNNYGLKVHRLIAQD